MFIILFILVIISSLLTSVAIMAFGATLTQAVAVGLTVFALLTLFLLTADYITEKLVKK